MKTSNTIKPDIELHPGDKVTIERASGEKQTFLNEVDQNTPPYWVSDDTSTGWFLDGGGVVTWSRCPMFKEICWRRGNLFQTKKAAEAREYRHLRHEEINRFIDLHDSSAPTAAKRHKIFIGSCGNVLIVDTPRLQADGLKKMTIETARKLVGNFNREKIKAWLGYE